jgi:hypothetical protein
MAKGRKTGGRKKGSLNKIQHEARVVLASIVDKKLNELDAMIDETRYGIEIEKTMTVDGKQVTVLGRLNADPGRAAKLVLEAAEYCVPKLSRHEVTGADGGAINFTLEVRKEGGS